MRIDLSPSAGIIQIRSTGVISGHLATPGQIQTNHYKEICQDRFVDRLASLRYSIYMKQLVTSEIMAKIDEDAQQKYFLPSLSLMETAGLKVWKILKRRIAPNDRMVLLCGAGNNGGDALVVARLAYNAGFRNLLCILVGSHLSPSCKVQRDIIEAYGLDQVSLVESIPEEVHLAIMKADYLLDGLAGTGLKGPLQGVALALIQLANQSTASRFAIDIPSGIRDLVSASAPHFHSDVTVTFGLGKAAMYHPALRQSCGEIVVENPSFPPQLLKQCDSFIQLLEMEDLKVPKLPSSAYKNSRGNIAIVGGSRHYTGAARLASRAAFTSRSGLVTLFCDQDVYPIAAAESPSVMVKTIDSTTSFVRYDALLVGPGWGPGREELLLRLFLSGKPLVLDADGIVAYATLLAKNTQISHGPLILTPHLGELKKLVSSLFPEQAQIIATSDAPSAFFSLLQTLSDLLKAVVVVKSSLVHIVIPHKKLLVLEGLNPSLGVAGSGDVLGGIMVSLLGGGFSEEEAAVSASMLHQKAGRLAHDDCGYYDSETLVSYIGKAMVEAER